jgi:hypothetical protein
MLRSFIKKMQFQYGVTSTLLLAGLLILYQAFHAGVPFLEPVFLYESMYSYDIYRPGELLGHPIYTVRKSARMEQEGLIAKFKNGRNVQKTAVYFFIPGNMGGYI